MENTLKVEPIKKRDLYYYRRRFLNRVFSSLAKFFADEAKANGTTKSMIAKKLGVDPSQITRWLSHPSNLTLESISDILLALDAEAEALHIVPFRDRAQPNYAHPVVAQVLHLPALKAVSSEAKSTANDAPLKIGSYVEGFKVSSMAAAE
ncbi:MAG: helix-turn-helix transcriptional regulator [Parvibaculum sp.]|uniref:helix-turn-helix domain-containing protein n=1 Tax=Parvibaculum sp. TaxID=2024848 RepID=UPI003266F443